MFSIMSVHIYTEINILTFDDDDDNLFQYI